MRPSCKRLREGRGTLLVRGCLLNGEKNAERKVCRGEIFRLMYLGALMQLKYASDFLDSFVRRALVGLYLCSRVLTAVTELSLDEVARHGFDPRSYHLFLDARVKCHMTTVALNA